jgi:hypothetical protein
MSAISVRVAHTQKIILDGWRKIGRGEYQHENGRRVRRDTQGYWECIGGREDGSRWQTMHWAMFQATK